MKTNSLFLFLLIIPLSISAQKIDYSSDWENQIKNTESFKKIENNKFETIDLSNLLGNELFDNGNYNSSYVGVFGPNYRRMDFNFNVQKKDNVYELKGKDKLGNNIRPIQGTFTLKSVYLREQEYITDSLYMASFSCHFHEPGDRNGDGEFTGSFVIVFFKRDNEYTLFQSASGDEPTFTNTFVGKWSRYNSSVERKVIFSFQVAGLYRGLPFCKDFYTYDETEEEYPLVFALIDARFIKYGWENYLDNLREKSKWW
ncbi:hypothetical protein MY04_1189 [Flammeovirga sp. MY04]|uniref:hypothetical protein n=1 Tax=Flammeovirga sp. MY04 TaxID=1191459 RepID=UPI0008063E98|nr:hypothetical protein [Flammeovirga sp. MY04]ANQ48566.1 hypothetical protein MY04_1189 [Flammeovirga sp. MY04]